MRRIISPVLANRHEALVNKQNAVEERAVGGALDLEVPEEAVDAEKVNNFVDNVVLIRRIGRTP